MILLFVVNILQCLAVEFKRDAQKTSISLQTCTTRASHCSRDGDDDGDDDDGDDDGDDGDGGDDRASHCSADDDDSVS